MVHPLVGKPAPAISLPAADGETYTLTPGAKGVPVALFFYPKSGTRLTSSLLSAEAADPWTVLTLTLTAHAGSYGCTKEACQFRDALAGTPLHRPRRAPWSGS